MHFYMTSFTVYPKIPVDAIWRVKFHIEENGCMKSRNQSFQNAIRIKVVAFYNRCVSFCVQYNGNYFCDYIDTCFYNHI